MMRRIDIDYKHCGHIPVFDGKRENYYNWRMKVTNWVIKSDHHYLELLRSLEQMRSPITLDMLTNDYYRGQSSMAITRELYVLIPNRQN